MSQIPATLEEANTRINAYIDKLMGSGHSKEDAIRIALESYKTRVKPYFAARPGEMIGVCMVCSSPIIARELYTFCAYDREVWSWHNSCADDHLV